MSQIISLVINMQKRAIIVFFSICFAMGFLCVRLFTISCELSDASYIQSHYKKITLDTLRLPVYDMNGKKLLNNGTENYIAARPGEKSLETLKEILNEDEFKTISPSLLKGSPSYVDVGQKEIANNDNVITLKKYLRYSERQTAAHLLGYVNSDGSGVSGIERCFDDYLKTDIKLYAGFLSDVNGNIVNGAPIETDKRYNESKAGVYLTLDSGIQKTVEEELSVSEIKKGAVLITDTKSGAIRAIASVPTYEPADIAKSMNDPDSPLVNRALSAFPVGSVFKVAVAAAALENGFNENETYLCSGSVEIDGKIFHCNNSTAHGEINMCKALEHSCNCYFVELSRKIGADKILETAKIFGFGEKTEIAKSLYSFSGKLPTKEELKLPGNLANFSFGQGSFTATPLQIANMFSAVANKGSYTLPYSVLYAADIDGNMSYVNTPDAPVHALSKNTAQKLSVMLKSVIENGTAQRAKTEGFACAGKTATAQTGNYNPDGSEKLCTWFGGYFPADNPKYTVVILKEDGSTGGADCAPVFKAIAQRIAETEKIIGN